ncbi:MAG: phosphoenolpyruvate--protein phosphotransferase, partial [Alphaproteobacteria bacterium]|nr:phosphoenolpyruvate--protein phosphotransferase [Alphaproteobacteria bacterium]
MEQDPTLTSSRRLLRRLRDIMAGSGSAQERLDKIVGLIAADMVAEVCSAYIMRAGEVLELFATEGLRREAVHRTRLRVGEGLVGVIGATARPLALADAQSHPDFAYRPETGEEIYHSLMGVPILRGGRVLGVLVVQNRTLRNYAEDEIEALQTIAMVLAELVAGGELIEPGELAPGDGIAVLPVRIEGVRLNSGLAVGTAVLHQPRIVIHRIVAEDPESELERLRRAVADMQSAIDELLAASDVAAGGEHRDVLETYRMFAADRGWLGRMREAVRSGLTAEAAVQKVQDDNRVRMNQVNDPYLRERLFDLEDLANRLLQHLAGKSPTAAAAELPDEFILVARSMGPAELLDYDRGRLKGLVLEEGSPTAHVAIVARALDIPVVGRAKDVLAKVEPGDLIVADGDHAQIFIRPGEDIQQAIEANLAMRRARKENYAAIRLSPAQTLDGIAVALHLNAGLLIDLPHLDETGAEGIGLYRTEIPFMVHEAFPGVEEQTALYRRILDHAGERPVTFRTLDIGGDKLLPYLPEAEEENPAMGWRAICIALDRPAMLRQQLRALLGAAAGRRLRIKFPMVAELAEFAAARQILAIEHRRAAARGIPPPAKIEIGIMLEVPALLWQLPALLPAVDFVSVGSNDLTQFLFACDRGNARLAGRYDPLAPAMLAVMRELVLQCERHRVPLSICGEMAGSPLDAMALIGLGFRTLSMTPSSIGPVKVMIRSLQLAPFTQFLTPLLLAPDHSVRGKIAAFARDHG